MQKRIVLIILFFAVAYLFLPNSILALTVGPAKMEHSIDPGNIISGNLFLMNETGGTQTFYPSFEKFIEADGEKQFLPKEPSELVKWIKVVDSVTLASGEQKDIPFSINVPKNASPGGHFVVIWWSTSPPSATNGASIVTRAGILVYLRVSGDIKESARILNFSSNKKFYSGLPINFSLSFENTGNVYLKPKGSIKIKNFFGLIKKNLIINENELQVLPESRKNFNIIWNSSGWKDFAIGPYKAEINLKYGEKENQISEKIWIFIFPWKIILAAILILIIIFFILIKGIKKYNKWIFSKYSKNETL